MAGNKDRDLSEEKLPDAFSPAVETAEIVPASDLPASHQEYLLQRHKALYLDPLPSVEPSDPLNWPSRKVLLASFNALDCLR